MSHLVTNLNDRRLAFEHKYVNDQEVLFKITAKRNKLAAEWVAGLIDLDGTEQEQYIVSFIDLHLEEIGDQALIDKIKIDLGHHGHVLSEMDIQFKLDSLFIEAKDQFMEGL